jgi:CBS domain containing-hemolysin-like protein
MIVSKSSKGAVWLLFFSAFFSGASFALMIADLNRVEQSGYLSFARRIWRAVWTACDMASERIAPRHECI